MRRHAVLLAALAAAVPAAPAAAQTTNPPAIGLHAVTSPPPEHRADPSLKTYVFRFGTYRIGRYQAQRRTDFVQAPPEAGSIVGMDVRILDESGNVIPQYEVMLHHMLFTNGGADDRLKDNACPGRPVQQKFFGTSEELRPLTLPRGYGYPTQPTDKWRSIWMLMNHQPRIRAATIEYRVTVDPSPDIVPVNLPTGLHGIGVPEQGLAGRGDMAKNRAAKGKAGGLPQNVIVAVTDDEVVFFPFKPKGRGIKATDPIVAWPRSSVAANITSESTLAKRIQFQVAGEEPIELDSNQMPGYPSDFNTPILQVLDRRRSA